MPQITINGNMNGQFNIGGESVNSPSLTLSIGEPLSKIEAADAPSDEKVAAKSKLQALLAHPVVAAIIGGLIGR